LSKEGKIPEWEWIDETRCVQDKAKKIIKLARPVIVNGNGGPMPNAPKM
jgi:hypothetical protein